MANLIALGNQLVLEGQIKTEAGPRWTFVVENFVVGDEALLQGYCQQPGRGEGFVALSGELEAYPTTGLASVKRVSGRLYLEVEVGQPLAALDASANRDWDITKIGQRDDTITGAPMAERIAARAVGWEQAPVWDPRPLPHWVGQSVDARYADDLVRLSVVVALRGPDPRSADKPRSGFVSKVTAVTPGEVTERNGAQFRRTQVSVLVGGVAGVQAWDLDVRL